MEHGDIHDLFQFTLNFKAGGGGDVFKIDAAEVRLKTGCRCDKLCGIGAALCVGDTVEADGDGINVGETLE